MAVKERPEKELNSITQGDLDALISEALEQEKAVERGEEPATEFVEELGGAQADSPAEGAGRESVEEERTDPVAQDDIEQLLQDVIDAEKTGPAKEERKERLSEGIDGGASDSGDAQPLPAAGERETQGTTSSKREMAQGPERPAGAAVTTPNEKEREVLPPDEPDEGAAVSDEGTREGRRSWYKSKILWISACALLFLAVAVLTFYFYYRPADNDIPKPVVLSFPVGPSSGNPASSAAAQALTIVTLDGFFVPAQPDREDITYLTADISIELAQDAASAHIKKYEPFFRKIVYDALGGVIRAEEESKFDQLSVKKAIRKALNDVLPERPVKRVDFKTFSII